MTEGVIRNQYFINLKKTLAFLLCSPSLYSLVTSPGYRLEISGQHLGLTQIHNAQTRLSVCSEQINVKNYHVYSLS